MGSGITGFSINNGGSSFAETIAQSVALHQGIMAGGKNSSAVNSSNGGLMIQASGVAKKKQPF